MSIDELEAMIMKLEPEARAELAAKLLRSLETLSDEANERSSAEEVQLRYGTFQKRGGDLVVNEQRAASSALSPSEKLRLVEDLWDDIASTPNDVPVHDWQKKELERRKTQLTQHPETGLSWEEVQKRMHRRNGG